MSIREYTLDFSKPEEAARTTVQMHKDTLIGFRKTTAYPEELEWEIRLYDFILEDPVPRLEAYENARYNRDDLQIHSKREVAKLLGWDVP